MVHQLRHLYVASPARSGSFLEEELLTTEGIARALRQGALPRLQTVTLEVFFHEPKEWHAPDLLLHRTLKERAVSQGVDERPFGMRWAILQPS
jgi:hypothetical protein